MGIKITKRLDIISNFPKYQRELDDQIAKDLKTDLGNEVIAFILQGKSPVAGKEFDPYSIKYANREKGGARSPVNMLKSGDMLESLFVERKRGLEFEFGFDSEIAEHHDKNGAGRSKVIRRLLPTRAGEKFNPFLQRLFNRIMNNAFSRNAKILQ